MINLSPAYEPVMIKGLTVHKDNPFLFDFIVDIGQDRMSGQPLKNEGEKLIKYFLASLAIPDKDAWVNLSPYEKDRTVPEALGQTDMGRDLLEQDYILKQITASLIYPEKQLGKTFWDKVYAKAQQEFGTTQVPINTFNKVWIMADKAEVFEHNQTAFVINSHLKVMLEEDYLALKKHSVALPLSPRNDTHSIGANIVRQIILPELEKEVNAGKNFANLRQIFNSIILASWYKRNLKQALLNQAYADRSKVKGINLNDPTVKEQIYEQYLKAYKKGVFNYIKEDVNAAGETMPRKYFSGGTVATEPNLDVREDASAAMVLASSLSDRAMVDFATLASTDEIGTASGRLPREQRSLIHQMRRAPVEVAYDAASSLGRNPDLRPVVRKIISGHNRYPIVNSSRQKTADAAMVSKNSLIGAIIVLSFTVIGLLGPTLYISGESKAILQEREAMIALEAPNGYSNSYEYPIATKDSYELVAKKTGVDQQILRKYNPDIKYAMVVPGISEYHLTFHKNGETAEDLARILFGDLKYSSRILMRGEGNGFLLYEERRGESNPVIVILVNPAERKALDARLKGLGAESNGIYYFRKADLNSSLPDNSKAMVVTAVQVYHDYIQFFNEQASRVDENGRFFDIKTNASSEPIRMRVSKVTKGEIIGLMVDKYNVVRPQQEVVIDSNEFEWAQEVDAAMLTPAGGEELPYARMDMPNVNFVKETIKKDVMEMFYPNMIRDYAFEFADGHKKAKHELGVIVTLLLRKLGYRFDGGSWPLLDTIMKELVRYLDSGNFPLEKRLPSQVQEATINNISGDLREGLKARLRDLFTPKEVIVYNLEHSGHHREVLTEVGLVFKALLRKHAFYFRGSTWTLLGQLMKEIEQENKSAAMVTDVKLIRQAIVDRPTLKLDLDFISKAFRGAEFEKIYKNASVKPFDNSSDIKTKLSLATVDIIVVDDSGKNRMAYIVSPQVARKYADGAKEGQRLLQISFPYDEGRESVYILYADTGLGNQTNGSINIQRTQFSGSQVQFSNRAQVAQVNGGIDLDTTNGMQWKVSKDGLGVEMNIDPAMIERARREGIKSLSPVILRMTPVASIWPLVGLQAPVK